jgi:hypothetical protein
MLRRILSSTKSPRWKKFYSKNHVGATQEGTLNFFKNIHHLKPKLLSGDVNWNISPIGVSGYTFNTYTPDHQFSLQYAIQGGCNMIDTSPNYNGKREMITDSNEMENQRN